MIDFTVLAVALVLWIWYFARKGVGRLERPWVIPGFIGTGAIMGIIVESMPFSTVRGGLTVRTFLAALAGALAFRLVARLIDAWARGYKDEAHGATRDQARLIPPLVAAGLMFAGVAMLHEAAASRHLALEIQHTPRDARTGIVLGAEPLDLGPEDAPHAVLLLHGYLGSPADYGDLPKRLADDGSRVVAPLLPGHGTTPLLLSEATETAWRDAALAAYDELAASHERVSVVGFSLGGSLAAVIASERPVHRLVLANPYAGVIATPSWCPIATDSIVTFVEPLFSHVMRSDAFAQLNKRENLDRIRAYLTVPIDSTVQLQQLGERLTQGNVVSAISAPTLLLLSERDDATPSEYGHELFAPLGDTLPDGQYGRIVYEKSNHILFLDHDAPDAIEKSADWVSR